MPRTTNTTKKTNSTSAKGAQTNTEDKEKIAELEAKIASLMQMLEQQASKPQTISVEDKYRRRVTITSIFNGGINLRTSKDGSAMRFRLDKFGATIPISVEDLNKCINTDFWLFTEGYVYINDQDVVKDSYLEDYYKKFLTPDTIKNLLTFDTAQLVDMVGNATRAIQETICTLIADNMRKGGYVDYNKIKAIGDACDPNIDIVELSKR